MLNADSRSARRLLAKRPIKFILTAPWRIAFIAVFLLLLLHSSNMLIRPLPSLPSKSANHIHCIFLPFPPAKNPYASYYFRHLGKTSPTIWLWQQIKCYNNDNNALTGSYGSSAIFQPPWHASPHVCTNCAKTCNMDRVQLTTNRQFSPHFNRTRSGLYMLYWNRVQAVLKIFFRTFLTNYYAVSGVILGWNS